MDDEEQDSPIAKQDVVLEACSFSAPRYQSWKQVSSDGEDREVTVRGKVKIDHVYFTLAALSPLEEVCHGKSILQRP